MMPNTIDERYEDLPAGANVPMDALFNGDTHRERLAALAGALTDEQVEHALHVLALDAAGERGILPAGVADYMASICRRYPEIRYGVTRIDFDADNDALIEALFYIDSKVTRDGMTLLEILGRSLPRRYQYLDIRSDVVDIRPRGFERSWQERALQIALSHRGWNKYAVYERAGDLAAPAPFPAPTQPAGAEISECRFTTPAQTGDLVWVDDQGDLIAGVDLADVGLDVMPVGIWVDGKIVRAGHIEVPIDVPPVFRIDATESEGEDEC